VLTVVALAALALLLLPASRSRAKDPAFVAGTPSPIPPFARDDYDWLASDPFAGGKMWMWTFATGSIHDYLYDLEHRVILGELLHGSLPEMFFRDGSRVLCEGRGSSMTYFEEEARNFVNTKLFRGKLGAPNRTESFWFLDLRDNSARMAGAISQAAGTGSRWHTSPNGRYGYTAPFAVYGKCFFLCDLEARTFKKIPIPGEGVNGWWDDRHILLEAGANAFRLLDIATQTSTPFFSAAGIQAFLTQAGLTNDATGLGAFANWNGHDYDFYFGPAESLQGLKNPDAWLLKADKAGPSLKLLYRNFHFRWSAHLDSTGTHYLYDGENGAPGSGGDGAVYLEDLTNGTTFTVVPPDYKGQYAIARFYGNEVIYFQNRLLRRIRLDGSNDAPLLTAGKQ